MVALKGVSFDLRAGEVHALCGENGAGKSTLIKLLSGLHPHGSYEGDLHVNGVEARFASLQDAARARIAVIYQELALVDEMSVAENIFLGSEPRTRTGRIDWPRIHVEARRLLDRFAIELDPAAMVRDLGVARKQLVEIVKALSKDSRVLIPDEPTAAPAEHEVLVLLDTVRGLRARGIACIYISHKLDEVFAVADRITVLRDGATVATLAATETDKHAVIRHMVGREITDLFPRRTLRPGEFILSVKNLRVADPVTGKITLHDLSFDLRTGEVLGIDGLMGADHTELLMHLFGAWGARVGGEVMLAGEPLPPGDPGLVLSRGLVLVSEERRRYGLVLEQSIAFNHLMTEPSVIFLDEPTRGIDVGAKLEIYETVNRLTGEGRAVVLASSELPELMGMSDRIVMLCAGRLSGEFSSAEFTQPALMAAAMGQNHPPAITA